MLEIGFEIIELEKVRQNSWNLVGGVYREVARNSNYKLAKLGEVCNFFNGYSFKSNNFLTKETEGVLPVIKISDINQDTGLIKIQKIIYHKKENLSKFIIKYGDILVSMTGLFKVGIYTLNTESLLNQRVGLLKIKSNILKKYIYYILRSRNFFNYSNSIASKSIQGNISKDQILDFAIPLPSLKEQQEIIEELDSYQKIIDGAKQVTDNWKPYFKVDKNWKNDHLRNFCSLIQRGKSPQYGSSSTQIIKSGQAKGLFKFDFTCKYFVSDTFKIDHRKLIKGDVLINSTGTGTAGRVTYFDLSKNDFIVDSHITILRVIDKIVNPKYLIYALSYIYGFKGIEAMAQGSSGKIELSLDIIKNIKIPLPPIEEQQKIVEQLDNEHKMIESQKEIISYFEAKVQDKLNSIWEQDEITKTSRQQNKFSC